MIIKKGLKNDLDEPTQKGYFTYIDKLRIPLCDRCMSGKRESAFAGLADLQDPPHKWHGFRDFAHNPEVLDLIL
jgi:hypothetical protein